MVSHKFLHQIFKMLTWHSPEKGKEDSLHALGSKYPRKDEKGNKDNEVEPT